MKILLNPKFESLYDYLVDIEEHFEKEGHEIFRDRNVIRTLKAGDLTLCVKRYAPLSLRGRLAVKFFKTPKGKKAFFRPLELRERGFESPEPVAFVKYRKGLTKSTTYFVSLHSDYRFSMAMLDRLDEAERDEVADSFGKYAARLHNDGFLHRDFSPGNILFDKVRGRYRFALVDTNSIRVGRRPVSEEEGCANLAKLQGDARFLERLSTAYGKARGLAPDVCARAIGEAWERERGQLSVH